MWPFGCRACQAKDSEIAFLRGILESTRTLYREPKAEPASAPYVPTEWPLPPPPAPPGLEYAMFSFSRNPIQSYEVTDGSDRIIDDDGAPD